jgi:3D (Asp-Asp-Asp) domain-containing protein
LFALYRARLSVVFDRLLRRSTISAAAFMFAVSACKTAVPASDHQTPPVPIDETPQATSEFSLPPPDLDGAPRLQLWATYYSVPRVRAARKGEALLAMNGKRLGPKLKKRDFCDAAMEGSVQVVDRKGRVRMYDYAGVGDELQVDCTPFYKKHPAIGRSRFVLSKETYGSAARGRAVPFRTIAVDPRRIPPRSVVFIPAARGTVIQLPNGETAIHDGYFYAADVGGGIRGGHIDVFLGPRGKNPFPFVKSTKRGRFEAYIVDDPAVEAALADGHQRKGSRADS